MPEFKSTEHLLKLQLVCHENLVNQFIISNSSKKEQDYQNKLVKNLLIDLHSIQYMLNTEDCVFTSNAMETLVGLHNILETIKDVNLGIIKLKKEQAEYNDGIYYSGEQLYP